MNERVLLFDKVRGIGGFKDMDLLRGLSKVKHYEIEVVLNGKSKIKKRVVGGEIRSFALDALPGSTNEGEVYIYLGGAN